MKQLKFFLALIAVSVALSTNAQQRSIVVSTLSSRDKHDTDYIESIEFKNYMEVVPNVKVKLNGREATITWGSVAGAQNYEVYHSADGQDFKLLDKTDKCEYVHAWVPKGDSYYAVRAIGIYTPNNLSISPDKITVAGTKVESGIYFGLVAFNSKITSYPMRLLNTTTAATLKSDINSLTAGQSTALYAGVDRGIEMISNFDMPDDIKNISIITFTDGLDNWSLNISNPYGSEEAYVNALKHKILDSKYSGQQLNAYSVGLYGTNIDPDPTSVQYKRFMNQLGAISSSEDNRRTTEKMDEVNKIFQEIASNLKAVSTRQTVTTIIPGQSDGTRIRFTFDNVSDAAASACYIEGTYNYKFHSLDNISCKGLKISDEKIINGEIVNDIFVKFNFAGVESSSGTTISTSNIRQWTISPGANFWQVNSEYTPDDVAVVEEEKQSIAVVLVLDCTTSLGETDFKEVKADAVSFINTLISK